MRGSLRVLGLVGFLVVGVVLLDWVETCSLYPRYSICSVVTGRKGDPNPPAPPENSEWLYRETDVGRLSSLLIKGKGRRGVVIYAHGNGESIDKYYRFFSPRLLEMGFHIFLFEYRGYFGQPGKPQAEKLAEDLVFFYDQIVSRPDVDPEKIVFHGRSLGGGVIGRLLEERQPWKLILDETFTRFSDIVGEKTGLPRFLLRNRYDTIDALKKFSGPVMVGHGSNDKLIPMTHGRRLSEVGENVELVVYPSNHKLYPGDWQKYWSQVERFLLAD